MLLSAAKEESLRVAREMGNPERHSGKSGANALAGAFKLGGAPSMEVSVCKAAAQLLKTACIGAEPKEHLESTKRLELLD